MHTVIKFIVKQDNLSRVFMHDIKDGPKLIYLTHIWIKEITENIGKCTNKKKICLSKKYG